MRYVSLNNQHKEPKTVSFQEALVKGLADDKGLYFPTEIPRLDPEFTHNLSHYSREEIAFRVIAPFIGEEIHENTLRKIVSETLNFDIPLVHLSKTYSTLELFHGPTMAFKDIGARFMARCLGYFNREQKNRKVRVLVATSGDTGGAVAHGFLNVSGVEVIILYPEGKVSDIQERQLTTLGANIHALRVKGDFDNCQRMVKSAFLDREMDHLNLTSANSINIARWLPQMFYYFLAVRQLQQEGHGQQPIFAVPSGNFGNICAGIMACQMGLPMKHFVAATNVNDTIPRYLETGKYHPHPTVPTMSNAMDVSDPSNFIRIEALFQNDTDQLKQRFSSYSFTDSDTKDAMKRLYNNLDYIADPHGAIGFLGAERAVRQMNADRAIFLETAHPAKFKSEVEETLKTSIDLPPQLQQVMNREKQFSSISTYEELKDFLCA